MFRETLKESRGADDMVQPVKMMDEGKRIYVRATPRNCVCEPQPSFCPISSV